MTWTVPPLGPPRVDFSWISDLADPLIKDLEGQRDARNTLAALDQFNTQQPQVAAPGGLAALQGTPGVAQPQGGASMGFSTRAQREGGNSAPFEPLFAQAGQKYGISPDYLRTTIGIESNFNPNAQNPNSSAGGLGQFIDRTAKQYGLTNKFDPAQAVDATARYAADNKAYLTRSIGREPTNGELYMAHQQGMGGATAILKADPNAPIESVIGAEKARINGGAGLTVGQFRQKYEGRFAGQQPVQVASAGGVPAFRSGLTPAQDGQNFAAQQQGAPGMQQTGMQPAATGSVADRSIVPGSRPNPVAMDQNQAAGNGDLADLQSIVMNPRSPPNMREWAIGELAKRGIKVPGVQVAQASVSDNPNSYNPIDRGTNLPPADRAINPVQRGNLPGNPVDYLTPKPSGFVPGQPQAAPIQPAPGYTAEQVAAAQAAAAQGQQRYAQGQQAQANQPATGASEVQGGYDVGGGRVIPVDQANNYAQPQQPQPPQNIQPPAQQQPQPTPQQVVGSVPVQAVARFNPQQRAVLAGLLASPGTRQLGMALIQKQLDPGHYGFMPIGNTVFRHNDKTGELVPVVQIPKDVKWGYTLVGGRLVAHNESDPGATRDATPPGMQTGERVMTPDERAEANLKPGDIGLVKADGTKDIKLRPERAVETPDEYNAKKNSDVIRERFGKISAQGDVAANNQLALSRLREAGGQIQGGTGGGAAFRAWLADRTGVKIGEDIGAVEAYSAAIDQLTPNQKPLGAGATSNFEEAMYKRSLPGLVKSPQGNTFILDTMDALNNLELKRADIATRQLSNEITTGEALKQMNGLNKDMAAINQGVRQKYIELQKAGALGAEGGTNKATTAAPAAPSGVIEYDQTGKRIK